MMRSGLSPLGERSLFVLRDADALGLTLEEANGKVRIRSMTLPGLGGLKPKDRVLASSLEDLLSDMLSSKSQSTILVVVPAEGDTPTLKQAKFARKGDLLAKKGKYYEAAATYALTEDDDPLVLANRCAALQLCSRFDESSIESNKLIQRWPKWEMGYVRKASCQLMLHDIHGAIRTLAQGLSQLPDNATLLWRMRSLIPEQESDVTCLGTEADTILSVVRSSYFVTNDCDRILSYAILTPNDKLGMQVLVAFNPLIPAQSVAIEVNGVSAESCRYRELRAKLVSDVQAVLIMWRVPTGQAAINTASSLSRVATNQFQNTPRPPSPGKLSSAFSSMTKLSEIDDKQLALRLSAVPQSSDLVVVFGAGVARCNGDYFPQGSRNERPWFENEQGVCLSYEQAESGVCGWVIGEPGSGTVLYVLRPGHEPRGEDFGQWLAVDEHFNPSPTLVGVGEKVPSLKKLTLGVKDSKGNGGPGKQTGFTTLIPNLLALKGHGIRLLEGGWAREALPVFELLLDQALALAVGDERCPSVELSRLADSAKQLKELAFEEIRLQNKPQKEVRLDSLLEGFTVKLFEDQSRQIEFKVLDGNKLRITGNKVLIAKRRQQRRRSWGNVLGCTRTPPPDGVSRPSPRGTISEEWPREGIDVEVVTEGAWRMLRVTNKIKTWETTLPDEDVLEALKIWTGKPSPSTGFDSSMDNLKDLRDLT